MLRRWASPLLVLLIIVSLPVHSALAEPREARLMRFPDIHQDFVVFVYGGDIWRASIADGKAQRLTSHEGMELVPKISPDGTQIAFSAEYSGTRQVYVMPSEGGEAKQLTFYNDVGAMPPRGGFDYWIQDWTSDGKILVRMNRAAWGPRYGRYHLVDPNGGLEVPLDPPHAGSGSLSPDGRTLAYTPVDREFRTWKRYKGGRAQDVWTYDLVDKKSERITTYDGDDNFPMWAGDDIMFTSDRTNTFNLFSINLTTRQITQQTHFDEYDVLWPARGPRAIVFMNGGYLYRFDFESRESTRLSIYIPDTPYTQPRFEDVSDDIDWGSVSPNGKRAVFAARGDLFTVPVKEGPTRNLTGTNGIRERDPQWSPDGKLIAYFSDATGEYELYVRPHDGSGEPRQITKGSSHWPFTPEWSPDSSKLAFADRGRKLWIVDVESGRKTEVVTATQDDDLDHYAWSPDSKWLAFRLDHPTRRAGIALYSLDSRKWNHLGDGLTPDFAPIFSTDGRYLFFMSNRDFQLRFSDFEFNYVYDRATRIFAASLDPDAPRLFEPGSDEEEPAEEGESSEAESDEEEPALNIDTDAVAFVDRTVMLPGLPAGDYSNLRAVEGKLYYRRSGPEGAAMYQYDLEEQEESEILPGAGAFEIAAESGDMLYTSRGSWGLTKPNPGLKSGAGSLDLDQMRIKLDPRAEWQSIFDDTWRIGRDWFYDGNMHGVDWEAMRERYGRLIPHASHRTDVDFLLGELGGELATGHVYAQSGDAPSVERIEGAMLGCEFEADESGYYKISKIFEGENWDEQYRSPLTIPGVDVSEGDYLIAIDGEVVKTTDNPFRFLEGKGHTTVLVTVNDRPREKGSRSYRVRPVRSERPLRYLTWVRERMRMADELSGGRVGYIHLPNTAFDGNRMLQKLFYSQTDKEALIVDDRFNGGGFIPDRMIEMLSRETLVYWTRRDVASMRTPGFAHDGPKAMLINGYAASGGDALPYFFRQAGLGPLIGTRTWGGLVGISGNPMAVDGGGILYPMFRIYDTDGNWIVENEGVAPDVEIYDLPELLVQGQDPSLEAAVEALLETLKEKGAPSRPAVPKAPDLSGR